MNRREDRDDPKSPAELRAAFIGLTHEIEAVEHIGRQNRLVGRHKKITEQLIAAGGNSEREILPLLDDPSPAVRYSAAFDVKPFDRHVLRPFLTRSSRAAARWAGKHDPASNA